MHTCDVDVVARRRWNCSTNAFLDMVYLVLVITAVRQEIQVLLRTLLSRFRWDAKIFDILNRID